MLTKWNLNFVSYPPAAGAGNKKHGSIFKKYSIPGFEPLYIFTNRYFFYRSSCVFPLEFTANYSFLEKMHNETLVPEAYICTIQKFCPDFEPFQLCMTENATGGCFIRKECPTWAPKAYDLYSKEVMTHPYSCDVREFFETGRKSRVESDPETEVGQTVETCDEMGFAKLQTITKEVNFVSYFSLEVVGFEVYIGSNVNNWHNHSSVRMIRMNKPRAAKVGAISKAQNCKRGDPLGFVKLQLVAKYEKK